MRELQKVNDVTSQESTWCAKGAIQQVSDRTANAQTEHEQDAGRHLTTGDVQHTAHDDRGDDADDRAAA